MVFATGITWAETPPIPTFWMHQLTEEESGAFINQRLNTSIFKDKLYELVELVYPAKEY